MFNVYLAGDGPAIESLGTGLFQCFMLSVECSEENVPLSHGIARYRTPDKSGFRIFAS